MATVVRKNSGLFFLRPPQCGPHLHKIYTRLVEFSLAQDGTGDALCNPHFRNFMASASSRRNQFLEWFPFYVHRFTGDVRYRNLKDFQQAWYWNLLFAMWTSERPGYLPDDGQLWRLAIARTCQFFEKERGPVMCMFEREGSTTDGAVWIYHRMLLEIYEEQVLKFHKRRRKSSQFTDDRQASLLDFEDTLSKKENGREKCQKHPQSGLTEWGTCWGCYEQKYSCG